MIKRNKIICKAIAATISLCVFNTYLSNIPVYAANQSTQNERQSEDSGTLKVDGMVIKNGVLISGEDAEGDIEIPSNVTKIADEAFWDNQKITSVKIPSSVTEIGESAFEQCENITKVNIPGSVKVIPRTAFCNNYSLTDLTIEDGVETIGKEAFEFNHNLKKNKFAR